MTITIPNVFVSWKTTLGGLAALALAGYTALHEPSFLIAIRDPQFQTFLILGILGIVAKDWNTTGGTVGQPSTPQALMDANQHPNTLNPPVGVAAVVPPKP